MKEGSFGKVLTIMFAATLLVVALRSSKADSVQSEVGRYQFKGDGHIFVLDTKTGEVRGYGSIAGPGPVKGPWDRNYSELKNEVKAEK